MKTAIYTALSIIGAQSLFGLLSAQPARPNIVFILADDMGYGDAKCFNQAAKTETPNIDSLGNEGVAFSEAFSSADVTNYQLYNLKNDPLEQVNLYLQNPEIATALYTKLLKVKSQH